jgi:nicotinate phosphoribosyltransferase
VIASGDLDEVRIAMLREGGAPIDAWGVGTRLITGHPDAAAAAVYKLGALSSEDGGWTRVSKTTDDPAKASLRGRPAVQRWSREGRWLADVIVDASDGTPVPLSSERLSWRDRTPPGLLDEEPLDVESLLHEVVRDGRLVQPVEALTAARERCLDQLSAMPPGLRGRINPLRFPVAVDASVGPLLRGPGRPERSI